MKLHLLKKTAVILGIIVLSLFLSVGCGSAGSGGSGGGVSATDVPEVQLSGSVGTADFDGSTTYFNHPTTKDEALEAIFYAMGVFGSAVEGFAMANENWEPSGTFEASPEDFSTWGDVGSVSASFNLPEQTVDLSQSSSGVNGMVTAEGSGSFEADITYIETQQDSSFDWFGGSVTLDESSVVMSGVSDPMNYDVTIPAGKILIVAGANAQVDPEWQNVDGWLEPEQIDAAAGLSIHLKAALSVADPDDGGATYGGNFLVEAKYTDSATLRITQAMMNNGEELQSYLENNLDLGDFSLTISVYNNSSGAIAGPFVYTVEDLVSFGESF